MKNGRYIEVAYLLDHPATELTPWGKAVSMKANEGGGWFTWVISTKEIGPTASKFGRDAIDGHRTRPYGSDLKWKQKEVKEIVATREFPYFIPWFSADHPSQDGTPLAEINKTIIIDKIRLQTHGLKKKSSLN